MNLPLKQQITRLFPVTHNCSWKHESSHIRKRSIIIWPKMADQNRLGNVIRQSRWILMLALVEKTVKLTEKLLLKIYVTYMSQGFCWVNFGLPWVFISVSCFKKCGILLSGVLKVGIHLGIDWFCNKHIHVL